MADYSFERLYAWLQAESRSLNWGMISVMDRQKLNLLLLQVYIQRFKTSAYLPPVTGSIANGNDERYALNQFTLDKPRLSFAGKQSNDSRARLQMQVMSGTQLGLHRAGLDWDIREIRHLSPLQGPQLSLDLLLAQVPGTVGSDARLRLDLKESDTFTMDLSDDPGQQRLVGEYFQQKFSALPDAQRVFPLGQIEPARSPFLRAKSFQLRTQARQRTAEDEEGAVLAMVRYDGEPEGHIPGKDFRYLVPNDKTYDAAVLLAPKRLMLAQLVNSLSDVVRDVEFTPIYDDEGMLTGARASRGRLVIPEQILTHDVNPDGVDSSVDAIRATLEFKVYEIALDLGDVFDLSVKNGVAHLEWQVSGVMAVEPLDLDSQDGKLGKALRSIFFDTSDFYKRTEDTFEYSFTSTYELEDVEGGTMKFLAAQMREIKAPAPPIGEIRATPMPEVPPEIALIIAFLSFYMLPLIGAIVIIMASIIQGLEDTDYPSVESVLREAFEKNFQFSHSMNQLVNETIKLNFGNVLIGQDQFAPDDIAFFGNVNPAVTAFAISPMEHTLTAGSAAVAFATAPAHPGKLRWTCEPVLDSVDSGEIGSIDENTGLYTPPAASAVVGEFVRVRIQAEHKENAFSSVALITVVKSAVQLNPLLYVTQANGTVKLQAGYLGDAAELKWSSPQHGRLDATGRTAVYNAPSAMPVDPTLPDDPPSFTFERVTVGAGTAAASDGEALIITESATKSVMKIVRQLDAAAGTVAMTAMINGKPQDPKRIQWEVVHGSGSVDPATGIYTHDASSSDRFALITATYDTQILGIYEGYVVQTLPPAALEDAVRGTGAFAVEHHRIGVNS